MSNRLHYLWLLACTFSVFLPFIAKGQIDHELMVAIKNCDEQAVQQRLSSNVNINATDSNGATPLMWAAYHCDVPIVKQLVQQGAKANDTGVIYVDMQNGVYFTNLQGIAADQGKLGLLQYLADSMHLPLDERDYNPETQKNDSWTPLSCAVSSGQMEVVRYLLKKGADVNVINPEGTTPLIMAAQNEGWAIFDLLVKGGGKEKLGEQTDEIIRVATELSKQGAVTNDWNKDLALQQFILRLKKIYFGEEHFAYAASLNYLAYLYHLKGQYERALPLYERAKAIAKITLGEEHHFYAGVVHNLAYLYREMGQSEKALPLLEHANVIAQKTWGKEHPGYATSLQSLASFYKDMGQFEKAMPLLKQAAAIRKKALGEESSDYTLSLLELANVYQKTGQYEKAVPLYEQAITIRKKTLGEEHPFYANSLFYLASLYYQTGRYEQALPLYEQIIAIRKKALGEEHPDYVQSLKSLAVLYQDMKQFNKALPLFADVSKLTLQHLALTYTALSEQEKMAFLAKRTSLFSHLPSLLFTEGIHKSALSRQIYAHELELKGMVLEDQKAVFNSIRKSNDSMALQLYEKWYAHKVFLGKQLLLPISQRVASLDSLKEATNQLEQQLSLSSAVFRHQQQQRRLTPIDIAKKLRKGEAAIEFINFEIYNRRWTDSTIYAALVLLPQDSVVHFIPLFEEKQLRYLLQSSPSATTYTAIDQLYARKNAVKESVADSLYQLIWKPLEQYLRGVQTVYYAPAGLLHRIAFQALPIPSGNLLIDQYQLSPLLSTRSLVQITEATSKPQSAHIWGNISYADAYSAGSSIANVKASTRKIRGGEEGWKPLPSTKTEIDSLKKVFARAGIQPQMLSGSRATEEAFKALSRNSPQVLHVATHGFFLPVKESKQDENDLEGSAVFTMQQNPMFRSGLVLAGGNRAWKGEAIIDGREDGILTAYEIAQMDLSSTGLVVLSACETALGDIQGNEGVIGLQRALKMAGVKQMIISLWQVPDKATMELITLFYKNWFGGQTTRVALRNAQLQLKEKYKHPYFWAGFVLVE